MLHFLGTTFGHFGVAILVFTLILKALFFPSGHKAYASMARMKVLAPRCRRSKNGAKDDPTTARPR